jgi:hypothetical protein
MMNDDMMLDIMYCRMLERKVDRRTEPKMKEESQCHNCESNKNDDACYTYSLLVERIENSNNNNKEIISGLSLPLTFVKIKACTLSRPNHIAGGGNLS